MTEEKKTPLGLTEYWRRKATPFCGGRKATEEFIRRLPGPARTDTWNPLPHRDVISALESAVNDAGLVVADKQYTLARHGNQMFGVWRFENGEAERLVMGFRSSLDKTLAVGICAGRYVMNCSNLMFYGDKFIEFRKHSGLLEYGQLQELAVRALPKLKEDAYNFEVWLDALAEIGLAEPEMKMLTYDAVVAGVLPGSKVLALDNVIAETDSYRDNLWGWYQAQTELWRGQSLMYVSAQSAALMNFLNEDCEGWEFGEEIANYVDFRHNAGVAEVAEVSAAHVAKARGIERLKADGRY